MSKANKTLFSKEIPVLTPIDLEGLNLTQRIVFGEKVDQLRQAENLKIKCNAFDDDESLELALYVRFNMGRFEAGLILLPGPKFPKNRPFPKEMLRVFGKDHELCLDTVAKHYGDLIKLHNLQQME